MKNINKLFAIAIVILGFSANSYGQASATADATTTAKIISPITLVKLTDMNFGIINSSTSGGTVILATDGNRTPTGVTLAPGGSPLAASFTVTGEPGYSYSVTLPTAALTLTHSSSPANTMTATAFSSNASTTLPSASFVLSVGATLNIGANQVSGVYNSLAFPVTVAYN